MDIPQPLITGSVIYLGIAIVLQAITVAVRASGGLSKDNAGIANVVIFIGIFCLWLFWLCAWMHQWHPLIKPIYEG